MDVILVGFIAGFIFGGWRSGLLRRLLGIAFMAIAFVAGAYFRYPVGAIATSFFPNIPADYANLVGYTIAFPVVLVLLHLVSAFVLRKTAVHGISRQVDGLLGAVFGAAEAILIISALIVIVDTYFGTGSNLKHTVGLSQLTSLASSFNASTTVHILRDTTVPTVQAILGPLLPKDLRQFLPGGLQGVPGLPGLPGLPIP